MYDETGTAYGILVKNESGKQTYYFVHNLQGDIIQLLDSSGTAVVNYEYNEWGQILAVTDGAGNDVSANPAHIANINPLRYRGYYYDAETGFYYLQSRYYDPETGRFINADSLIDGNAGILGNNLFIYAANNPVNNFDPSGHGVLKNALKKAVKLIAKSVVKPVVKTVQKILSKHTKGTIQAGGTVTGSFGVSGTASVGIAFDGKGNVGVTITGGGGGGSPSASACIYGTRTTAPTIKNLEGSSSQIGGSADALGVSVGVELTAFTDSILNQSYFGGTVMAGIGAPIPAELHGDITYTKVFSINIFDEFYKIYDKIMSW